MYTFVKYNFRNWAVYAPNGDLVCVTVYKKGAKAAAKLLNTLHSQLQNSIQSSVLSTQS